MNVCTFPKCSRTAHTQNRLAQPTCHRHKPVVVLGSWIKDAPKEDA